MFEAFGVLSAEVFPSDKGDYQIVAFDVRHQIAKHNFVDGALIFYRDVPRGILPGMHVRIIAEKTTSSAVIRFMEAD
jgi:hypothetical protein